MRIIKIILFIVCMLLSGLAVFAADIYATYPGVSTTTVCMSAQNTNGGGSIKMKYYFENGTSQIIEHAMYNTQNITTTLQRNDLWKAEVIYSNYGGEPSVKHSLLVNNVIVSQPSFYYVGTNIIFLKEGIYPAMDQITASIVALKSYGSGNIKMKYYFEDGSSQIVEHAMYRVTNTKTTLTRNDLCKAEVIHSDYTGDPNIRNSLVINDAFVAQPPSFSVGKTFILSPLLTGRISGEKTTITSNEILINNCTVESTGKVMAIAGKEIKITGETKFTAGSSVSLSIGASDYSQTAADMAEITDFKMERNTIGRATLKISWTKKNPNAAAFYLVKYAASDLNTPVATYFTTDTTYTLETDDNEYEFRLFGKASQ